MCSFNEWVSEWESLTCFTRCVCVRVHSILKQQKNQIANWFSFSFYFTVREVTETNQTNDSDRVDVVDTNGINSLLLLLPNLHISSLWWSSSSHLSNEYITFANIAHNHSNHSRCRKYRSRSIFPIAMMVIRWCNSMIPLRWRRQSKRFIVDKMNVKPILKRSKVMCCIFTLSIFANFFSNSFFQ